MRVRANTTRRRTARQVITPKEHDEQVVTVNWFRLQYPQYSQLLYAVPNGAALCDITDQTKRAIRMNYLKAEGFSAGVSDLVLALPRGQFHGAYIEMKSLTGSATKEQLEFIDAVSTQGYFSVLCRGSDAAIKTLKEYMLLGSFDPATVKR